MQPEPQPPSSKRENFLAIVLGTMVGGISLFFLWLITLGIVDHVLGIGVLIVAAGVVHYFVWGRSMNAQVAAEREAMLREEARAAQARPLPADAIQDISRTQAIQKK
jgi:hypothetical protein